MSWKELIAFLISLIILTAQGATVYAQTSVGDKTIELEGELKVTHSDDFERNVATYYHVLKTKDNKTISLHFADKDTFIRPAKTVKVKGVRLDNEMAVQGGDSIQVISTQTSSESITSSTDALATTTKKVLVLLVNFIDDTSQPWTIDQVKSAIFGPSNSVNTYYTEQSFNQLGLSGKVSSDGDVYGWYALPFNKSICKELAKTPAQQQPFVDAVNAAAQAAGVDTTGYDNYIYIFPKSSSCGWSGQANNPPDPLYSFINGWGTNAYIISHELGHNFNTYHASGYNCIDAAGGRVSISAACSIKEYGDPFDVMGSGFVKSTYIPYHMNNYHKGQINWWDPVNTLIATSSGTYTLSPIEQSTLDVTALLVPRTYDELGNVLKYYYLEYRQPFGTDSFSLSDPVVNGASIRLASPYTTLDRSWLIDTTPATASFIDSPLLAGQVFTDPAKGISFTTANVSSTSAQVEVNFTTPVCVRAKPNVFISPSIQWGFPGQSLTYTVTVTNNDSTPACSESVFNITPTFPSSDWSQSPDPISLIIAPETSQSTSVTITPNSTVPTGLYSFTLTAVNSTDPQYFGTGKAYYNLYLPDTTPPATSITAPLPNAYIKGTVTIKASASDDTGVTKVEFYVDGVLLSTDTTANYTASWNTGALANGSAHQLETKAYDSSGNIGSSAIINVTIDRTQPTVSITSPINNTTVAVNSTVTITADASDNFAMSKVNFFIDNTKICTDSTSAYSCDWVVPAAPGVLYTIKATAVDQAGNSKSATIKVTSQ